MYTMVEYFVPIFSIYVIIRSVFWGEFYITNEFSHAKCQLRLLYSGLLSVSVHIVIIWTLFTGILVQISVHNI